MAQRCRTCNGHGRVTRPKPQPCPQCGGTGIQDDAGRTHAISAATDVSIEIPVCPKCGKTSLVMTLTSGLWQCARPSCADRGVSYRFSTQDILDAEAEARQRHRRLESEFLANSSICPRCGGHDIESTRHYSEFWDEGYVRIRCRGCDLEAQS
jgi:RecJ-like exonuclease